MLFLKLFQILPVFWKRKHTEDDTFVTTMEYEKTDGFFL